MAFSGNNQSLYNAALNGALAGQLAGSQVADPTSADYATIGNVASAFAKEVDAGIVADATLTTAGATLVPADAAHQANALAKPAIMFQLCFGYWQGRRGADIVATDYAVAAAAIAAAYAQAVTQYGLAPGGTSLS